MATVNLGAIKFNWKGAYSNSTAYAVDDVVSSGGSSYVCIQAHTNQPVGNATAYWNIMSSAGTNGTNGTDVGTVLTTQGDILYRDGSGLQRLPKGTANQELRINSGATAPEWFTPVAAGGDFEKIATGTVSNASYIDLDGTSVWGTAGTYSLHKVVFRNWRQTQSSDLYARQLNSGSLNTSTIYSWNIVGTNSSTSTLYGNNGDSDNSFKFTRDQIRGDSESPNYINFELTLGNINAGANEKTLMVTGQIASPNHDGSNRNIGHSIFASTVCNSSDNANRTGIRFFPGGGNYYTTWTTYGMKV
jgi:hypothetical protein